MLLQVKELIKLTVLP